MNHQFIRENEIIEAYLSRHLSPDQVDRFEEHLLYCNECRQSLKKMEFYILAVQKAAKQDKNGNGVNRTSVKEMFRLPAAPKKSPYYIWAAALFLAVLAPLFMKMAQSPDKNVPSGRRLLPGLQKYFFPAPKSQDLETERLLKKYAQGSRAVHFKPNIYLQDIKENLSRNKNITVYLKICRPLDKTNQIVQLTFKGHIHGANERDIPVLTVYSNKIYDYIQDNYLYRFKLTPYFLEKGHFTFQIKTTVTLSEGLYYFTIQQNGNDPLYVGSFTHGRI